MPEVTGFFTTVGQTTGSMSGSQATPYAAEITVKMVDAEKRNMTAPEFARKVEIQLEENIVGAEFTAVSHWNYRYCQ
ncbi:hypothetical protein QWY93_19215 [Echinicola jeungdonensis]|uniref:hypothetical protein n=1 Tax=Echinicola jeungdonensis TaxID=709343 RepID=UPI0025B33407|nr:hypothetical protein [Echinicola jeungdonensis]MDN3671389.1 hypothetical protein [Echinicola jeungdonensis]